MECSYALDCTLGTGAGAPGMNNLEQFLSIWMVNIKRLM